MTNQRVFFINSQQERWEDSTFLHWSLCPLDEPHYSRQIIQPANAPAEIVTPESIMERINDLIEWLRSKRELSDIKDLYQRGIELKVHQDPSTQQYLHSMGLEFRVSKKESKDFSENLILYCRFIKDKGVVCVEVQFDLDQSFQHYRIGLADLYSGYSLGESQVRLLSGAYRKEQESASRFKDFINKI